MDKLTDLLEYIVPVVVFILMGIGKLLERRSQRGEESEQSRETGNWNSWEEEDEAERTRQIQEEIRRKIAERRGEAVAQEAPPPVPARPVVQQRQRQAPPPLLVESSPPLVAPVSMEVPRNYVAELEAQEKALKEALQRAESIRAGAHQRLSAHKQRIQKHHGAYAERSEERHSLYQEVINSLQNPLSARKAFLLQEILGPPMALRRGRASYLPGDADLR